MIFATNVLIYMGLTAISIFIFIGIFIMARRDSLFTSPFSFFWDMACGSAGIAIGWPILGIFLLGRAVYSKIMGVKFLSGF